MSTWPYITPVDIYYPTFHTDQKHICQNLNQFGYGRGTVHGGDSTRYYIHLLRINYLIGCSEYTIIPARYAYLLKTDITDAQASILERKPLFNPLLTGKFSM